jgi:hypothetical protein
VILCIHRVEGEQPFTDIFAAQEGMRYEYNGMDSLEFPGRFLSELLGGLLTSNGVSQQVQCLSSVILGSCPCMHSCVLRLIAYVLCLSSDEASTSVFINWILCALHVFLVGVDSVALAYIYVEQHTWGSMSSGFE